MFLLDLLFGVKELNSAWAVMLYKGHYKPLLLLPEATVRELMPAHNPNNQTNKQVYWLQLQLIFTFSLGLSPLVCFNNWSEVKEITISVKIVYSVNE